MRWTFLLVPLALGAQTLTFRETLYPVMREAQCYMCHNDNGVATATRVQFPPEDATAEQIEEFGLGLQKLVDRQSPEKSLLGRGSFHGGAPVRMVLFVRQSCKGG